MIDAATVYSGADAQSGSVSQKDRQALTQYLQQRFTEVLGKRYLIVASPEPGTVRLHLILTGLKTSTPVLSTLSHILPAGLVVNGVSEAAGGHGTFYGSVSYAAELSDASTGKLLRAYVAEESPAALNVMASLGTLDAAKAGVRIGAGHLSDELARDGMLAKIPQQANAATNR